MCKNHLNYNLYIHQKQADTYYFCQMSIFQSIINILITTNPIIYNLYHLLLKYFLLNKHIYLILINSLNSITNIPLKHHNDDNHLKQQRIFHLNRKPIFLNILNIFDSTNPNLYTLHQMDVVNLIVIIHSGLRLINILYNKLNKIRQSYPKYDNNHLQEYIIQ